MIKHPEIQPTDTFRSEDKVRQDSPEKPRLSMEWFVDPITGKPVARWVLESAEIKLASSLAVAA